MDLHRSIVKGGTAMSKSERMPPITLIYSALSCASEASTSETEVTMRCVIAL